MRNIPSLTVLLVLAIGCESTDKPTTRPLSFHDRQEQALRDPMNYKPDFSNDRISSGGITDFDREGFNKDLKSVLNP